MNLITEARYVMQREGASRIAAFNTLHGHLSSVEFDV